MRAEELVYNENFRSVEHVSRKRKREDELGGMSTVRVLGAPCVHTKPDVLRAMLSVLLDEIADTYDGAWQPEDYGHEDLLIEEFAGARVGSSTYFCADWRSSHKATSDYFLYYSLRRIDPPFDTLAGEAMELPMEPSSAQLESMDTPPPNYIHDMQDYCNHHYFGQVINRFVNICKCRLLPTSHNILKLFAICANVYAICMCKTFVDMCHIYSHHPRRVSRTSSNSCIEKTVGAGADSYT
jgi:hypothetical protein